MKKQKAIKEAYGEYWEQVKDYVKEDGSLHKNHLLNDSGHLGDCINIEGVRIDYYRPSSLKGIENNNGWIKIESQEDLPEENSGLYFVCNGNSVDISRMSIIRFRTLDTNEVLLDVTHYQPIIKPKPPLY